MSPALLVQPTRLHQKGGVPRSRGGAEGLDAPRQPAPAGDRLAAQILGIRARINRILSAATGQPVDKIAADTERNHWMTAEEARAYGLVERIVATAGEV